MVSDLHASIVVAEKTCAGRWLMWRLLMIPKCTCHGYIANSVGMKSI